jgi:membrane-bound lytic murein transglycosylase B
MEPAGSGKLSPGIMNTLAPKFRSNSIGTIEAMYRIFTLSLILILSASCMAEQHPGAEAFASKAAAEHQLNNEMVLELLLDARYKQSIIDAMTRPAEGKPWYEYRPIFITDDRIEQGIDFWKEHAELVALASQKYQVDPQIIVAIIGVETFYGRITGSYRVLDALATLSFYYPDTGNDRSDFFSRELMHFMLLGEEEGLPLRDATGSYAGAMGLGQFMPSSYREYAVDLDGDGRRDLWSSMDDVIGSVANYLHRHKWHYGEPVAKLAVVAENADPEQVARRNFKAEKTVGDLAVAGFTLSSPMDEGTPANLVQLELEDGKEHWISFHNFYVITRYNRSPLYAMAVLELSEAIRNGFAN